MAARGIKTSYLKTKRVRGKVVLSSVIGQRPKTSVTEIQELLEELQRARKIKKGLQAEKKKEGLTKEQRQELEERRRKYTERIAQLKKEKAEKRRILREAEELPATVDEAFALKNVSEKRRKINEENKKIKESKVRVNELNKKYKDADESGQAEIRSQLADEAKIMNDAFKEKDRMAGEFEDALRKVQQERDFVGRLTPEEEKELVGLDRFIRAERLSQQEQVREAVKAMGVEGENIFLPGEPSRAKITVAPGKRKIISQEARKRNVIISGEKGKSKDPEDEYFLEVPVLEGAEGWPGFRPTKVERGRLQEIRTRSLESSLDSSLGKRKKDRRTTETDIPDQEVDRFGETPIKKQLPKVKKSDELPLQEAFKSPTPLDEE